MTALNAHRTQAVVQENGRIIIPDVPLPSGEVVEVIVYPVEPGTARLNPEQIRAKLRGSVLREDDPFGPATPPEDWDALR